MIQFEFRPARSSSPIIGLIGSIVIVSLACYRMNLTAF